MSDRVTDSKPRRESAAKTISPKGAKARAKLKAAGLAVLADVGYHKMRITDVTAKAGVASVTPAGPLEVRQLEGVQSFLQGNRVLPGGGAVNSVVQVRRRGPIAKVPTRCGGRESVQEIATADVSSVSELSGGRFLGGGRFEGEAFENLQEERRRDPAAREAYREYLHLHHALRFRGKGVDLLRVVPMDQVIERRQRRSLRNAGLAAVAVLVLGAVRPG